jgi:drug/metabolite transporter (DMT)-like permease
MQAKHSTGVLLCIIATAAWGGMFPVMDRAMRHIDPFTFTCLRYSIALVAFLAVLVAREGRAGFQIRGERTALAWFFGTCGFAGFQFLVFFGQKIAGVQGALIASIMMVTQPMLGFFVNWVVRKAAPPAAALAFIVMSFVGVTLVITKGHISNVIDQPQNYGANILILLGCLCWVIYTVGGAFFPRWSPLKYTTVTTGLGLTSAYAITTVFLATGIVSVPTGGAVTAVVPELAYMGLVAGFIGVLCWNLGNKILTPLNGVLFMDVVPITAFAILTVEGTVPVLTQFVGAGISATALILNNLFLRHRMAAPAPAAPAPAVRVPEKAA